MLLNVCRYMDSRPSVYTIVHIVSASPTSTDIREVLLRICRELKARFPSLEWDEVRCGCTFACCVSLTPPFLSFRLPPSCCLCAPVTPGSWFAVAVTVLGGNLQEGQEEYQAVKDGFFKALEHAGELGIAERCPVVLIVDAVNQLNPFNNALSMDWFPALL